MTCADLPRCPVCGYTVTKCQGRGGHKPAPNPDSVARSRECEKCGVPPGEQCRNPNGTRASYHAERYNPTGQVVTA